MGRETGKSARSGTEFGAMRQVEVERQKKREKGGKEKGMKGRRRSVEARGVTLGEYLTYITGYRSLSLFLLPPLAPGTPCSLLLTLFPCRPRPRNPHAMHSTSLRRIRGEEGSSNVRQRRAALPEGGTVFHTRAIGARCRDRVRYAARSVTDTDVDLLERYCEHTRTARRRALCERRRLRHAAAILLRQRGDSAGADKAGQIRATSEPPDVRSVARPS